MGQLYLHYGMACAGYIIYFFIYSLGIWPPCSMGLDINSVDRSSKSDVIVTGDDFSKIKLFRYPCARQN